jgi:hypothetical protein
VTNGTAGGTQELTSVASASSTGLDPSDMTVFNNDVLFNGVDANGLSEQPCVGELRRQSQFQRQRSRLEYHAAEHRGQLALWQVNGAALSASRAISAQVASYPAAAR